MRVGLTISCCAHAAVLGWTMLSFSSTEPLAVSPEVALPVDLVSVEEFTELTTGLKDGDIEEPPAVPDAPEEIDAAPDPEPEPEPEPVPEPPQPAEAPPPPPEPEPEPEQAEAEPEPEAAPEEPEYVQLPRQVSMPRRPPRPRPVQQVALNDPAPERPNEQERDFDPDDIAALLDKQERDEAAGGAVGGTPDAAPSLGAPTGLANRLSMSEIDYLRQQISRCWNPPVGVLDAAGLVVKLDLELTPDGSLTRPPIVANTSFDPIFTIASEAAKRAVVQCQPYVLPPEKYDTWRRMIVNFDPREMLGG